MEKARIELVHGAIGSATARLRFKPKHQVTLCGVGRIVLRHLNVFNGNIVSITICLALFFALTLLAVFADAWDMAGEVPQGGFSLVTRIGTHFVGFIFIAKILLNLLSPLLNCFSRGEHEIRSMADDFRVLCLLFFIGLTANTFFFILGLSGSELNTIIHKLTPYISFPSHVLLLGLIGEIWFLAILFAGIFMIFVAMTLHEFRGGPSSG
jgi:hypothetical protein